MCGINGFFSLNGNTIELPGESLRRMNDRLIHRGPDDSGVWNDSKNQVYLGHRRLSIIDLSKNAAQPFIGRNGDVLVFNGEIYNFRDLKGKIDDYFFKSNSDTEVILAAYELKGTLCLDDFNGMFAFALWDQSREELFLARDRMGQKPLYYSVQNGIFAFSSELKALLELPWIKKELDLEAFYHFLTFNKLPSPFTMFKGIMKFNPAHYMRVGKNGIIEYKPFWKLTYQDLRKEKVTDVQKIVFESLDRSVKLRMVSDVPVGAFLSGGVDSSAVVGLMTRYAGYPVKTYSVGFEGQVGYDERIFARKVANLFKTDHYEKVITSDEIRDFISNMVEIFDEPLSDPTSIPIYFISNLAREKGTKVVLTGDGGDELFAGYRNWQKYIKLYPFYKCYSKFPAAVKLWLYKIISKRKDGTPLQEIVYRASKKQEFFWGGARSFKENIKKELIGSKLQHYAEDWNSHSIIAEYRDRFDEGKPTWKLSDTDWMCYLGLFFVLPEYFLFRGDRLGMANSVELRTPFMDHFFVKTAMSVPAEFKTKNNEPKYILKKSLETLLPRDILYRPKMGFCVPIREWGQEIMEKYLIENSAWFCRQTGLLEEKAINSRMEQLRRGNFSSINDLWMVFFVIQWIKKWIM